VRCISFSGKSVWGRAGSAHSLKLGTICTTRKSNVCDCFYFFLKGLAYLFIDPGDERTRTQAGEESQEVRYTYALPTFIHFSVLY